MQSVASKTPIGPDGPIGVFDSGVGGLSVLRHIRKVLPHEDLLYFADAGFAPYGDKPEAEVLARSFRITEFLLHYGAKTIVIACNSATASAIGALRERYPGLPLIGIEPGLKPAAQLTQTRIVGVLATRRTLASKKFELLHERVASSSNTLFLLQPCPGLASQIERGELRSAATTELVQRYVAPLIRRGADILVLGCTHYPFVQPLIENSVRQMNFGTIRILDTGEPVTRQLVNLLQKNRLQRTAQDAGMISAFTSGSKDALADAFSNLLQLMPPVTFVPAWDQE